MDTHSYRIPCIPYRLRPLRAPRWRRLISSAAQPQRRLLPSAAPLPRLSGVPWHGYCPRCTSRQPLQWQFTAVAAPAPFAKIDRVSWGGVGRWVHHLGGPPARSSTCPSRDTKRRPHRWPTLILTCPSFSTRSARGHHRHDPHELGVGAPASDRGRSDRDHRRRPS